MSRLLEVKNLTTNFHIGVGCVQAVRNVSFHLDAGESLGIVGESGSGKSVTMMSIMGLLPDYADVTADSIRFGDREMTKMSVGEFRKVRGNEIGMIFQDPMTSLNPLYTVENQIAEPLRIHRGMSKAEARKAALELLKRVEIPNPEARLKQYPHELSGGMRQRVMIAMALACEPDILIADEPTTALDVTIQAQILELMQELQKKLGMAIIMITHDLGVIADMCDEIIVMYAGRICERGTADEIFYNPRHEYTKGLLRSIPRLDTHHRKLIPIAGSPVDLTNMPKGCAFASRCDHAMKICLGELPEELPINDNHMASCWMNVKEVYDEAAKEVEAK